jgi:hypothetical protein
MLKITRIAPSAGKVILRLEGKLIGPWVNELKSYCEIVRREGRQLLLQMTEVSFADRAGIALLRGLEASGGRTGRLPAVYFRRASSGSRIQESGFRIGPSLGTPPVTTMNDRFRYFLTSVDSRLLTPS